MIRILIIVSGLFVLSACSKMNKILKSTDYEYKLKKGYEFYEKKKYNQAQIIFEDVFPIIKGTDKYEDLYYKYAYTSFLLKDYLNAENLFKGFVDVFPTSVRTEECDYMRAFCFYKQSPKVDLDQTNTMKTITYMQTFIGTHPNSTRIKDAQNIIEALSEKLELKEYKSAELYLNLGYYKSAATAFTTLSNNFPDSKKSDAYKLMVIKSVYNYANNSVIEKQSERFENVLNECADFIDRFPDSKLLSEVENYKKLSENNLKSIKNEQVKTTN